MFIKLRINGAEFVLAYICFGDVGNFNVIGEFRLDPLCFYVLVMLLDFVLLRLRAEVNRRRFTS